MKAGILLKELVRIFTLSISLFLVAEIGLNTQILWYSMQANSQSSSIANSHVAQVAMPSNQPSKIERPVILPYDSVLIIPSLGVTVPIVFSTSSLESSIDEDLRKGVSHRAGSAAPGTVGNVFIEGHSSNYGWESGLYNHVFALLGKLTSNETVYVGYAGKEYVYTVSAKKIVSPSEFSIAAPTDTPTLSLMTCYPPGTLFKRLVVQARLTATYD